MQQAVPPTQSEIYEAAERIRGVVRPSPLVPLHEFDPAGSILLKPETLQAVNSFKIRGVFNAVALMTDSQRSQGISTVSAGNTAQALAWAGRYFGVPARSIMPDSAPKAKIEAVRAYGGTPELVPMAEVFRYMKEHLWEQESYSYVHPWTDRAVMIGHATIALEVLQECPDVDSIFVPVGGGGLMGGVGSAIKLFKPDTKVIGVEPTGCASLHDSLAVGKAVAVDCDTICDGVAVPYMTEEMFPLLRDVVDEVQLVSDAEVKTMVKRLALGNKIVSEPSGALAAAAAVRMPAEQRGTAVCLVTGGSIDAEKLISMLQ